MRALILVAGAALAVAACSSNDNANNTMNVDENVGMTDMNATTDLNATDANMTMNGDLNVTTTGDVNVTDANASTNNAM
jgi:uncharacterized protein YcfL